MFMEIVDINFVEIYEKVSSTLAGGGLVMHPTETCYGLAVDVFNEDALKKLYKAKEMEADKPVSILVSSVEMARVYGEFSQTAMELVDKFWPGALSIVVPRSPMLPKFFNEGHEFVSIRFADHKFCNGMVEDFGKPVTTTSANKTGELHLYNPDLTEYESLEKYIDVLVDGGDIEREEPSTMVKVEGDKVEILRQGGVNIHLG
jgi:L-threonylcarbamoyladenylate synthase